MDNVGVIDRFLGTFSRMIDSGFGLLNPEVTFIASTLIVIDVTMAFLFWAWSAGDDDLIARLVKKTIFIGFFAYIISNWTYLADVVLKSFAGLGVKAAGTDFTYEKMLKPGAIAQLGLDAGRPLLDSISDLMGIYAFFENFIQIVSLGLAWLLILMAFFVLAIQLFITLIEFKLTTLAGFILIPFGLFNKSNFMAEKVLGNVVSSGIKVLVLGVIIGIGSTLFNEFKLGFNGETPTIDEAMTIVLAALSLLGIGIFGPKIADGLVSGGPQMGAGSAVATGMAVGGAAMGASAAAGMALRGAKAAASMAGGAARGASALAGGARLGFELGRAGGSGGQAVLSGLGGAAKTGASALVSPLRKAASHAGGSLSQAHVKGMKGAYRATGGTLDDNHESRNSQSAKAVAKKSPSLGRAATVTGQALKSGDSGGIGNSIKLDQQD